MSTRNEKAKRLNANEDNLLQMEMERFQKQHNKEMKSIILERQTAKEAMSGVRRQRASSLLVARMVLQETNRSDNSPALPKKVACEPKQNKGSSKMVQGLETDDDGSSCWKTYMLNLIQKESDLDREILDNCNLTSMPSQNDYFERSPKCTQAFSEGTTSKIVQSSGTLKNTRIVQKPYLPNPPQKTSSHAMESAEYIDVPYIASKIDHFERSPSDRPRSFAEAATDARSDVKSACSLSGSRRNPITISRNSVNHYQEQQGNSVAKSVPLLLESVGDDNRPRNHSSDSMLFKRRPTSKGGFKKRNLSSSGPNSARSRGNSPEPDSFHSPLILRSSLPRTPPAINRRFNLETSKLFTKRSSLEPCHKSSEKSQNKLSPSRGIAKFRQIGSAAAAAQTLVSRYQREKAISSATEHVIAYHERKRSDKERQEHHQLNED